MDLELGVERLTLQCPRPPSSTVGLGDTQAPPDFPSLHDEKQAPQCAAAQGKTLRVTFSKGNNLHLFSTYAMKVNMWG